MKWKTRKQTASQKRNFTIMRLRGMFGQTKSIGADMPTLFNTMRCLQINIEEALKMLDAKSQHDHERDI